MEPITISPSITRGKIRRLRQPGAFPDGTWFEIAADACWKDGVVFKLPAKGLPASSDFRFLTFDILLDCAHYEKFTLEAEGGSFSTMFSSVNWCQTRIVLPVSPAAFSGARHLILGPGRKQPNTTRICISPCVFQATEPPRLENPVLPHGPVIDAMGQSRLARWANRTPDIATMIRRLRTLAAAAPRQKWPAGYSRWGGWLKRRVESTGFFRTHHDGNRWWLVDPDGYLFWSSGLDCVDSSIDHETIISTRHMNLATAHTELPRTLGPFKSCFRTNPWHAADDREFNYLEANFIRTFGPDKWYANWSAVAHAELRRLGFNTAGDWSDEHAAQRAGTPYTRPLELYWRYAHTPMAAGSLPDVFHPNLAADIAIDAQRALAETRGGPALLGYFLNNEPAWHMRNGGPAAAMLCQTPRCYSRIALADFLRRRHRADRAMARAWDMDVTFRKLESGAWHDEFTPAALKDLNDFSTIMIRKLCDTQSRACRKVDPDHLNLGVRWWTFPPLWVLKAMGSFDVISFNYYQPKVDTVGYGAQREAGVEAVMRQLNRPFMVGEWHIGAFDAGLPSAGLYATLDQEERARAFRVYLENAAALPWCVGAHWFNMYDRTALYCTTGSENYSVGLLDITHNSHRAICAAARAAHAHLYRVTAGEVKPCDTKVAYTFPSC